MDEIRKKQIRARLRFKALVRLVIANKAWLMEMEDVSLLKDETRAIYTKNVSSKHSPLLLQHKAILMKQAQDRTDEEKMSLYKIIGGLKCFRKYQEHVKMLLAGYTYFAYFGEDRVIVKQHHVTKGLYFIIKGDVSISSVVWDPVTRQFETKITGKLTAGDIFGEGSLLFSLPRRYTITTITSTEFLILYRDDFNFVLKDTVEKEWSRILEELNGFTYFETWDDITKKECCMMSKIKTFVKDETILGDGHGADKWVHFVLKGQCRMIEHIYTTGTDTNGAMIYKQRDEGKIGFLEEKVRKSESIAFHPRLTLLRSKTNLQAIASTEGIPPDLVSLKSYGRTHTTQVKFIQVCIFSPKACFGIGEPMKRRRIVAMGNVECLLIPRYWLLTKGQPVLWNKIQIYLQNNIPSSEELFFELREQKKWYNFKRDLVKSQIKKPPCNCVQNIPYTIRMNQDFEYSNRM